MSTPKKRWWKSKVFWFNAITTVISLAEVATPMNIVSAPVMLEYLSQATQSFVYSLPRQSLRLRSLLQSQKIKALFVFCG